jgi:hypothetical protein
MALARLRRPAAVMGAAFALALVGSPAWAGTAVSLAAGGDPPGANGTVKIDDFPVDDAIRNEPHVGCRFEVKFFDFDAGEHVNIVFTVQEPTGPGTELLRRDNVLVSTDAAGGGKPDPDEVFTFSASQLGLGAYTPQPHQGFHVKLTIERIGAPGAGKHKVFWVQPCAGTTSSPSSTGGANGGGSGGGSGGGPGGGAGGGLPITGTAVGRTVLVSLLLVGTGVGLLVLLRRRRDGVTFEA